MEYWVLASFTEFHSVFTEFYCADPMNWIGSFESVYSWLILYADVSVSSKNVSSKNILSTYVWKVSISYHTVVVGFCTTLRQLLWVAWRPQGLELRLWGRPPVGRLWCTLTPECLYRLSMTMRWGTPGHCDRRFVTHVCLCTTTCHS